MEQVGEARERAGNPVLREECVVVHTYHVSALCLSFLLFDLVLRLAR
jgi:hypothetical protein